MRYAIKTSLDSHQSQFRFQTTDLASKTQHLVGTTLQEPDETGSEPLLILKVHHHWIKMILAISCLVLRLHQHQYHHCLHQ
jgi:hypothetical protein